MSMQTEAELLMQLRKDYEARGFVLTTGENLDTGSGGRVRPDLVARKEGATVLIAVRPYGSSERDEDRIRALSELAAHREGWSFRLYFVEGPESALPEIPDEGEISHMLGRARELQHQDDGSLALLAAWSALEAATRRALAGNGKRPKLFAGSSLVKELIAHGFLGQDNLTRFHDLAHKRDLAAHGFFRQPPEEQEVGAVIALAESVAGNKMRDVELAALDRRSPTRGPAKRTSPRR